MIVLKKKDVKLVRVTTEDNDRAFNNYSAFYSSRKHGDYYSFLGKPQDHTPSDPYFTYHEEAARKIQLLASPHYHAILKAHEALKNG